MPGNDQFTELSTRPYKDQACWFLNGFWPTHGRENAEVVWDTVKLFAELDPKGVEGNELNEFDSHRVLEKFDNTLSVVKMREVLRSIDQDANGHMSMLEYLTYRFNETVEAVVNSPQGDNQEEVARCQAELEKVATALKSVMAEQEIAAAALAEAQKTEAEVKAAEAELEAAVAELKAQEDAYNAKIAELEAKSTDTSVGVVTRNKAANELAQLKGEDPLPLRKAKITQEAALRRVQKARVAAEAATAAADAAKKVLDQKLDELSEAMAAAEAELQAAKQKGGVSHGNFWWMERELYEADESLPRAKQKYDHSKPLVYTE